MPTTAPQQSMGFADDWTFTSATRCSSAGHALQTIATMKTNTRTHCPEPLYRVTILSSLPPFPTSLPHLLNHVDCESEGSDQHHKGERPPSPSRVLRPLINTQEQREEVERPPQNARKGGIRTPAATSTGLDTFLAAIGKESVRV